MKKDNLEGNLVIFSISFLVAIILVIQAKSLELVEGSLLRDEVSSVFTKIQLLYERNSELEKEIELLENNLEQLSNQDSALEAIAAEITDLEKLSGEKIVFGKGLVVKINGDISGPWLIDLVNDFFASGAEAVSINGIRLVNNTIGFDTLPQGQILIKGSSIISQPFEFELLGESKTMLDYLTLPGGIIERLENAFAETEVVIEEREVIEIESI